VLLVVEDIYHHAGLAQLIQYLKRR
jgi:hypothetical protein